MAAENFLWQMGSSNHKDHRPGSDDRLFFEHILFHNIREQVGSGVLGPNNVQLLLFDSRFHSELWRCLQQSSIVLPCWWLGGGGCSRCVRGINRFPVLVRSTHPRSSRCWLKHLCTTQRLQHNDIQQRVEFRMLGIPVKKEIMACIEIRFVR